MFTGIVEDVGKILNIDERKIHLQCKFLSQITLGQSICHDGVCLTVFDIDNLGYWIEIGQETIEKTNFKHTLKEKTHRPVNLERSMLNNGRFDGHIVQGHVDETVRLVNISQQNNSYIFDFNSESKIMKKLTVEKGSVCINGVSLTINDVSKNSFSVCVIPYTYEKTNFKHLKKGCFVNVEYDILGKYILKNTSY